MQVQLGTARYIQVHSGKARYSQVQPGTTWYSQVQSDKARYSQVQLVQINFFTLCIGVIQVKSTYFALCFLICPHWLPPNHWPIEFLDVLKSSFQKLLEKQKLCIYASRQASKKDLEKSKVKSKYKTGYFGCTHRFEPCRLCKLIAFRCDQCPAASSRCLIWLEKHSIDF